MSRPILKGATDQSIVIFVMDETAGTPEIGVDDSTAGLDLWYRREGSTLTAIVATDLSAISDSHADGGLGHIANGLYRLDPPDAAFAGGVDGVMVGGSVTGMIVIGPYIPLYDIDPYDSVRGGMTALPNAAADAAGGLPISDAGGLDLDTIFSVTEAILADTVELISTADAILTDTDEIGAAGAGLTAISSTTDSILADTVQIGAYGSLLSAIPWNAAWDTEVQSEIGDAIPSIADGIWDEAKSGHTGSLTFGDLGTKTGFALSAAGIDSIWDEVMENSKTARQFMTIMKAALAGISTGGGSAVNNFRNDADGANLISAGVDADGNRISVTFSL